MDKQNIYKELFKSGTLQNAFNILQQTRNLSMKEFNNYLGYIYEKYEEGVLK